MSRQNLAVSLVDVGLASVVVILAFGLRFNAS